jgi:uncharacterized membrane protein
MSDQPGTPGGPSASTSGGTGLDENIAGLLSYVLGWITGLIFFLIDKRPFVRFHAAQSIVLFGGLFVLYWVVSWVFLMVGWVFISLWIFLGPVIGLAAFVLWIVCMVKAYQGQRFRVPVVADLADKLAK